MGIRDSVSLRRKEQAAASNSGSVRGTNSANPQDVLSQEDLQDEATFHHEDALDDAFDRQVTEGRQRLARPRPQQFVTGFMGGIEIGLGVLIGMSVTYTTGSMLLGGLAFSLGFVTLLLAHSELFTEGFLVPTFAVIARRAKLIQLVRFWFYTFLGNLVGGLAVMWVVVTAFPAIRGTLDDFGEHFAGLQPRLDTVLLALLAGVSITLMTRMQMGTDQVIGKIVAAVFGGVLLFGVGMLHSVLDTLMMFGAWFAGAPEVSLLSIVNFLWWVIPLNMLGGIMGVALPRAIQARDRVRIERLRVVRELLTGVEYANDARGALMTGREVREDLEKDLYVLQEDEPEPEPNAWEEWGNRISDGFTRLGGLDSLARLRDRIARDGDTGNGGIAQPFEKRLSARRFPWQSTPAEATSIESANSAASGTTAAATPDSSPTGDGAASTSKSVIASEDADATTTTDTAAATGAGANAVTATSPVPTSVEDEAAAAARKRAEKEAREARKRAEKEERAARKCAKEAEEALKEKKKAARRAQREAERAAEEAAKNARRAKREALKRAERAAKRAAKDAHKARR